MNSNKNIIQLTNKAVAYIKSQIAANEHAKGLRLLVKSAGCSGQKYATEITTQLFPGDHHEVLQGVNVYIEQNSIKYLQGVRLDYLSEGLQTKLIYQNPKANHVCGCGESFSLDEE